MKQTEISAGLAGYHVILLCTVASRCRKGTTTVEDAKAIEAVAEAIAKHLAADDADNVSATGSRAAP